MCELHLEGESCWVVQTLSVHRGSGKEWLRMVFNLQEEEEEEEKEEEEEEEKVEEEGEEEEGYPVKCMYKKFKHWGLAKSAHS